MSYVLWDSYTALWSNMHKDCKPMFNELKKKKNNIWFEWNAVLNLWKFKLFIWVSFGKAAIKYTLISVA